MAQTNTSTSIAPRAHGGRPPRAAPARGMPLLAALLQARNISRAELARRIGVTPAAVGKWTLGHVNPHPMTLRIVAEVLGVSEAELVPPLPPARTPLSPIAAFAAGLTERQRDVFRARVVALDPATLEELAARWDVSPRDIAGIERAVTRRFDAAFTVAPATATI